MKLNEAIAKRLTNILQSRNLTPYKVSKIGGISKQAVYAVANGEYSKVSTDILYQITSTLQISLSDFFSDHIFTEVTD